MNIPPLKILLHKGAVLFSILAVTALFYTFHADSAEGPHDCLCDFDPLRYTLGNLLAQGISLAFLLSPVLLTSRIFPGMVSSAFAPPEPRPTKKSLALYYLFLLGGAMALLAALKVNEDQRLVQMLLMMPIGYRALLCIPICTLTPLVEEMLFRGVLLRLGPPVIFLPLSSLLFALAHGPSPHLIPLFFLGWAIGWLTLRCNSIRPAIILHALFNLLTALDILLAA